MRFFKNWGSLFLQQGLSLVVLLIMGIYVYAHFFVMPILGFEYDPAGYIFQVDAPESGDLQIGDRLMEVDGRPIDHEQGFNVGEIFSPAIAGESASIFVEREGDLIEIHWEYSFPTQELLLSRLNGSWWLPIPFWLVGTAVYLFIRPRNLQWRLLVAFNFLTAIWVASGNGPSGWQIWGADIVFKITLWLFVFTNFYLHWVFPKPLSKFPSTIIYLGAIVLFILDEINILPSNSALYAFVLSMGSSFILLVTHAIWQPSERPALKQLTRLIGLLFIPMAFVTIYAFIRDDLRYVVLTLIVLPLVPAAYIYAIYRHQLGELEIRANRLIVIYLYISLLLTAVFLILTFLSSQFTTLGGGLLTDLSMIVLTTLITILGFNRFERFVERRILGMPIPPANLLQTYASQITTKLDKPGLAHTIIEDITPSLLVRQSALVYYDFYQESLPTEEAELTVLFEQDAPELPTSKDLPALLAVAHTYRLSVEQGGNPTPCPWIKVVLPLFLGERVIGLWLLGKRDPDDFYSQAEIKVLKALAGQTAVALANILQAQNLHAMYQANIDQQEHERNQLALDLHDDILNQIGLLGMYVDEDGVAPQFFEVYDQLTDRFRETIHGLRPVMLNYGLFTAFNALVDNVEKRPFQTTQVKNNVPQNYTRYPIQVERHLYRIVQQAVENALQHAEADNICIHGTLNPDDIEIVVEDDGIGVSGNDTLDLSILLQRKHFGLAGMFERAELIGAKMHIKSIADTGTIISLNWSPEPIKRISAT